MGVKYLWQLLQPVSHEIDVNSSEGKVLDGKVLAIDVSLWLHQSIKGMRDAHGDPVHNAHLVTLFNRTCKLLYFGIKPVFVFDGGISVMKKRTMELRKRHIENMELKNKKNREKILNKYLKRHAISHVTGKTAPIVPNLSSGDVSSQSHDIFQLQPSAINEEISDSDSDEVNETGSRKPHDDLEDYEDVERINFESDEFMKLPNEVQLEKLLEMQTLRFENHWTDIDAVPQGSSDFSSFQMGKILKNNKLTSQIEVLRKEINLQTSGLLEQYKKFDSKRLIETQKIASEDMKHYLLIKTQQDLLNEVGHDDSSTLYNRLYSSDYICVKCNEVKGNEVMPHKCEIASKNHENFIETYIIESDKIELPTNKKLLLDTVIEKKLDLPALLAKKWASSNKLKKNVENTASTASDVGNLLRVTAAKDTVPHQLENHDLHLNQNIHVETAQCADLCTVRDHNQRIRDPNLGKLSDLNTQDSDLYTLSLPSKQDPDLDQSSKYIIQNPDLDQLSHHSIADSDLDQSSECILHDTNLDKLSERKLHNQVDCATDQTHRSLDNTDLKQPKSSCDFIKTSEVHDSDHASRGVANTITKVHDSDHVPQGVANMITEVHNNDHVPQGVANTITEVHDNDHATQGVANTITKVHDSDHVPQGVANTITEVHYRDHAPRGDEARKSNQTNFNKNLTGLNATKHLKHFSFSQEREQVSTHLNSELLNESRNLNQETADASTSKYNLHKVDININDACEPIKNDDLRVTPLGEEESLSKRVTENSESELNSDVCGGSGTLHSNVRGISGSTSQYMTKDQSLVTSCSSSDNEGDNETCVAKNSPHEAVAAHSEFEELHEKDIYEVDEGLGEDIRSLQSERAKRQRMTGSVTEQMYLDAQELLTIFGIPFIVSPMEAEAQCAYLDIHGLTNGTITEDSDIWLFGGRHVYKNFFSKERYIDFFDIESIQRSFDLDRAKIIMIALLCGSDYTPGLTGVGPVTALEILHEFSEYGDLALDAFREWWDDAQKKTIPPIESAVKSRLRKLSIPRGFPDQEIIDAYKNARVDESLEPLSWKHPDFDALKIYARKKMKMSDSKLEQILAPVMKKFDNSEKGNHQMRITQYLEIKHSSLLKDGKYTRSKRVKRSLRAADKNGRYVESEDMKAKKRRAGEIYRKSRRKE